MATGLSEEELEAARKVFNAKSVPANRYADMHVLEEIVMPRAFGTDTVTLEADVMRAFREAEEKKKQQS
jgi:hypothetical protein